MKTTREDVLNNLHDPAWLRSFLAAQLCHRLELQEKSYRYWKSDRESEPVECETGYFDERGIALCRFDDALVGQSSRGTRAEVVVFESGELYALRRSQTCGYVRSDFESYAHTESRDAVRELLSGECLAAVKERIADQLLSAAKA